MLYRPLVGKEGSSVVVQENYDIENRDVLVVILVETVLLSYEQESLVDVEAFQASHSVFPGLLQKAFLFTLLRAPTLPYSTLLAP